MSGVSWKNFTNDTGDRTKIINANEVNANFDWSEQHIVPHNAGTKTGDTYDLGESGSRWRTIYSIGANFSGNGRGLFPLKGLAFVLTDLTGDNPSVNDGWALANGTTAASQGMELPIVTEVLPDINNGAFIRGATSSWTTGGASGGADTHAHGIGSYAFPNHSHAAGTLAVDIASFTSGAGSAHSHTTAGHVLTVDEIPSHTHGMAAADLPGVVTLVILTDNLEPTSLTTWGNTNATGGGSSHSHGDTGTESSHTHTIDPPSTSVTGSTATDGGAAITGTSASASTLPVYFSAVCYIRCK